MDITTYSYGINVVGMCHVDLAERRLAYVLNDISIIKGGSRNDAARVSLDEVAGCRHACDACDTLLVEEAGLRGKV